jgi:sugar-phosphatase
MSKSYAAFLFDMDGTLITSVASAERVWTNWAIKHGVDVATYLPSIHGVRSVDSIRALNRPDLDVEKEAAAIEAAEIADTADVAEIPGAAAFLASLPPNSWAIVTSASLPLARARLGAAGFTLPAVIITAEEVTRGKPDPQGYKLAAQRLGVDPKDCMVFEDAPAGIAAGEAAGADVTVITATHSHPVGGDHYKLRDYRGVTVTVGADGRLSLVE